MTERIGEANVGLLVDTYHVVTEETDLYRSITVAGDRLSHFYIQRERIGVHLAVAWFGGMICFGRWGIPGTRGWSASSPS